MNTQGIINKHVPVTYGYRTLLLVSAHSCSYTLKIRPAGKSKMEMISIFEGPPSRPDLVLARPTSPDEFQRVSTNFDKFLTSFTEFWGRIWGPINFQRVSTSFNEFWWGRIWGDLFDEYVHRGIKNPSYKILNPKRLTDEPQMTCHGSASFPVIILRKTWFGALGPCPLDAQNLKNKFCWGVL